MIPAAVLPMLASAAGSGATTGAGATAGKAGGQLAGMIPGVVGAALSYIPSKQEQTLIKQAEADQKRLAGGGGGYAEGELQKQQAAGMGMLQSQTQQALSQLARGSAMGGGESGVQTAKQLGVLAAAPQAAAQMQSQIRERDLAYRAQQLAQNRQLQLQLAQMEQVRRQMALQQLQQAMQATPEQAGTAQGAGQAGRADVAGAVGQLAGGMG